MSGSEIILLGVLFVAVAMDVRTGKIKNWLTLPAIASGPIVHFIEDGSNGAVSSLAGLGAMILVAVVLVMFGIVGGGDVKLLVAVGSLAGLPMVKDVLIFSALAGGVMSIILMIVRRRAVGFAKELAQAAWLRLVLKADSKGAVRTSTKMPYSIAIAAGTIAAIFWRI